MTKVGDAILEEYVAEVNERIEDDKNRIRVLQGFSTLHGIWRLALLSISAFFGIFILMIFLTLRFLDARMVEALRNASNDDVVLSVNSFFSYTSTFTGFVLLVFVALTWSKYIRDKKQERLDWEQEQAELRKTIIEISEELLLRHKLIQAEKI